MTAADINALLIRSDNAFRDYRTQSLTVRRKLLHAIGDALEARRTRLIETAISETHLSAQRLNNELTRTIFQLRSYGDYCATAAWMDIRIDTGDADRQPPKPDLRKMQVPLGPVIVFGAANFPFAYSTAGGDTASALAAGCSVLVKAHPGHLRTGELAAAAVLEGVTNCGLPEDIFIYVPEPAIEVGEALVKHPLTKAVGFTGSYRGGRQLFDWGNQREVPIPVFAEMSSVNPVFILPEILKQDAISIAEKLAASMTLDVGQFCTNPGIVITVDSDATESFINTLSNKLSTTAPAVMLNEGIAENYLKSNSAAVRTAGVATQVNVTAEKNSAAAILATVSAADFIANRQLQQEVFGPYSIVVRCKDFDEMKSVAKTLAGQLTATVFATPEEVNNSVDLMESIRELCGRFIFNGVPTGVEVCLAMQHGGPFPASTDSRFTSVGADAIRRFTRPQSFQNWPEELLPPELQNANPLRIWRTVDNELTAPVKQ